MGTMAGPYTVRTHAPEYCPDTDALLRERAYDSKPIELEAAAHEAAEALNNADPETSSFVLDATGEQVLSPAEAAEKARRDAFVAAELARMEHLPF